MTERLHTHRHPSHPPGRSRSGAGEPPPGAVADVLLVVVIAACFVPVGLLVVAVHGGGPVMAIVAFIALVFITAALVAMIERALDEPGDEQG